MEQGLPEEDNELSREGQLLHDYMAHPEYERKVLTQQQQDLLALSDELQENILAQVNPDNKHWSCSIEQTISNGIIEGTPDLVAVFDDFALVQDFKFGRKIVERAELNLQLRAYAVICWHKSLSKIYVAIIQPRLSREERVTIAEYTVEDIENSHAQIVSILAASDMPDAPLVPGEEQCRYCKAKMICPAFRDAMMVPVEWRPDKALSKAAREAYLEQRLAECTDEQLEKVIEAERLAKMIHEPLYEEARKRIRNGQLTNFELGKATEVREITDVRKAIALLSLAGLDKSEIFDCVNKMSLTDLQEVLRKKNATWSGKQTRDWIDSKLSSVIEKVPRKERVIRK